jgi:hypothetical protein
MLQYITVQAQLSDHWYLLSVMQQQPTRTEECSTVFISSSPTAEDCKFGKELCGCGTVLANKPQLGMLGQNVTVVKWCLGAQSVDHSRPML